MTIQYPSSISEIRAYRKLEEEQAFRDYTDALRKWERARERADDAAWELQVACADLQQKMIAGCSGDEAAELHRACRQLEAKHRRCQHDSQKAKERASATFTALVTARNARLQLDRCLDETDDHASKILPFSEPDPFEADYETVRWN